MSVAAEAPKTGAADAARDVAPPHTADLDSAVDRTVAWIMGGLSASAFRPSTWRCRPWDAEHRKLYGRLLASLQDLRRLERVGPPLDDDTRASLVLLLSGNRALASTDSTLEVVDEVRKALVPRGDVPYLKALLVDEGARELRRTARAAAGATRASTLVGWSDVFPGRPLKELLAEEPDDKWVIEARDRLGSLYETRRERYRLHRARIRMKADYLALVGLILLALDVAVAVAVAVLIPGGGIARTCLAAFSGALGGTVSGAYQLRDQVENLNEVRAFKPALWVQPLLGAAAGLVLLLVLESGLIAGGTSWQKLGIVAFAGGFSEPFFLGIVKRVTTAGGGSR